MTPRRAISCILLLAIGVMPAAAQEAAPDSAVVRIRHDEDIDGTFEYLAGVMADNDLVLAHPETEVFVSRLEDSWVELSVWPWTRAEHGWTMQTNLRRILRLALDERGTSHAFPRYEIGRAEPQTAVDPQSPRA